MKDSKHTDITDDDDVALAAPAASVFEGIVSLATSVTFRCALVASVAAGNDETARLLSLSSRLDALAAAARRNADLSLFADDMAATACALRRSAESSRSREPFRLIPADAGTLLDIADCASVLDSASREFLSSRRETLNLCLEALDIAVAAFRSVLFPAARKLNRETRGILFETLASLARIDSPLCSFARVAVPRESDSLAMKKHRNG